MILSMATDAVEIKDVAELGSLAKAVETNAQYSIRSSGDYGRRIETLQRRMEREPEAKAAAKCAERIQELVEAREYASRHSLVPEEPARRHQNPSSDRWQYESQRSGNRSQRAAQSAPAPRERDKERQQGGRSR